MVNTKTPLAERSEERRLCSQVRETRRSAISLVQMTKKIVFVPSVSTLVTLRNRTAGRRGRQNARV